MPRNSEYTSIAQALNTFIESHNLRTGIDNVLVKEAWENVMGKTIAQYTTSLRLTDEVLSVHLSSSVLREELSYGKEKIITLLNEKIGRTVVRELVLR